MTTYRPLTKTEIAAWLKGANFGAVVAGAFLRTQGMESATNSLYLRVR